MPWKEKTNAMLREEYVNEVRSHKKSKRALCKEYGISRPTGDKWLRRAERNEGYEDRSHRTFGTPKNKISQEMEELLVARRKKEP